MTLAALDEKVPEGTILAPDQKSEAMLRLLTCGSVDDGKSTLIGRLLWDAAGVTEDQRAAVMHASHARGVNGEKIDFSLLLDGLQVLILALGLEAHFFPQLEIAREAGAAEFAGL